MQGVMSSPHIVYTPRPDTTPGAELSALVGAYRFILDCHAKKEGGPATSRPDEPKGSVHDRPARRILQ